MNNVITQQSVSSLTQSLTSSVKNANNESARLQPQTTQTGNQPAPQVKNRQDLATAQPKLNTEERLEQVVQQLNSFVQQIQRDLNFSIDRDSGRTVVKVLHAETKEVIRQIPSEEVLNRLHNLEDIQGLLFRDQA